MNIESHLWEGMLLCFIMLILFFLLFFQPSALQEITRQTCHCVWKRQRSPSKKGARGKETCSPRPSSWPPLQVVRSSVRYEDKLGKTWVFCNDYSLYADYYGQGLHPTNNHVRCSSDGDPATNPVPVLESAASLPVLTLPLPIPDTTSATDFASYELPLPLPAPASSHPPPLNPPANHPSSATTDPVSSPSMPPPLTMPSSSWPNCILSSTPNSSIDSNSTRPIINRELTFPSLTKRSSLDISAIVTRSPRHQLHWATTSLLLSLWRKKTSWHQFSRKRTKSLI